MKKQIRRGISTLLALLLLAGLSIPTTLAVDSVYYESIIELNIRTGAGTSYSVVTSVPKGDVVEVTSMMFKEWWKVKYTNSNNKTYEGYVNSSDLKETTKRNNEGETDSLPTISLRSLTTPKSGWIYAKWKAAEGISGYEMEVSESKDFKTGKHKTNILSKTHTSMSMSGLEHGKVYYARIRAYRMDGEKNPMGSGALSNQ